MRAVRNQLPLAVSHIEKCRNLYYATLKVPEALRGTMGRTKFKKSLGTADKRRAHVLAAPLVAMWGAEIRQAAGEGGAVHQEALRWRAALASEEGERAETVASLLVEKAHRIEAEEGEGAALHFADVAFGRRTPSSLHFASWTGTISTLAAKTQDQMKKDVQLLTARFSTLEEATPTAVRKWVDALADKGASASSIRRMVSFWRSYWRHLVTVDAVPDSSQPFGAVTIKRPPKAPELRRAPFTPDNVVKLWEAAETGGDLILRDLVRLGAYTGARIEELCSLELKHIGAKSFRIVDAKTGAGIREVPIHSALVPLMQRLRESSTDGYLLAGLTFNKYGDRSNAIGKRFGRLKESIGFGPAHVFHSLRKTLITMLEDLGVSENLAADIVGHEKPRITYGLYSGGASLATKAAALELMKYPGH